MLGRGRTAWSGRGLGILVAVVAFGALVGYPLARLTATLGELGPECTILFDK